MKSYCEQNINQHYLKYQSFIFFIFTVKNLIIKTNIKRKKHNKYFFIENLFYMI